jgi:S-methylmethionine-dependent homocysteine/selenocysteine methylase
MHTNGLRCTWRPVPPAIDLWACTTSPLASTAAALVRGRQAALTKPLWVGQRGDDTRALRGTNAGSAAQSRLDRFSPMTRRSI